MPVILPGQPTIGSRRARGRTFRQAHRRRRGEGRRWLIVLAGVVAFGWAVSSTFARIAPDGDGPARVSPAARITATAATKHPGGTSSRPTRPAATPGSHAPRHVALATPPGSTSRPDTASRSNLNAAAPSAAPLSLRWPPLDRGLVVVPDAAPPATPLAIRATMNVPFTSPVDCGAGQTCTLDLDVYSPTAPGPWPVVVLLRGGPGGLGARAALSAFAAAIASHGIVVMNADYRDSVGSGGGYPRPFEDVACAIRFARAAADRYGGNGDQVTLVGHSLGAYVGAVVALTRAGFGGNCLEEGSGAPDAFVGIAGPYLVNAANNRSDLAALLGGGPAQMKTAWAAGDPIGLVGDGSRLPIRLVHGSADTKVDVEASRSFDAALTATGYDVGYTEIAGGDHSTVIDPTLPDGRTTIGIVIALARGQTLAGSTRPTP